VLAERSVADHFQDERPEHAIAFALAGTNEDAASLMARQKSGRLFKREGSEDNRNFQFGF
jgi:hypothetical protein